MFWRLRLGPAGQLSASTWPFCVVSSRVARFSGFPKAQKVKLLGLELAHYQVYCILLIYVSLEMWVIGLIFGNHQLLLLFFISVMLLYQVILRLSTGG